MKQITRLENRIDQQTITFVLPQAPFLLVFKIQEKLSELWRELCHYFASTKNLLVIGRSGLLVHLLARLLGLAVKRPLQITLLVFGNAVEHVFS